VALPSFVLYLSAVELSKLFLASLKTELSALFLALQAASLIKIK
jgi:hypothetical protein